jgi:lysyl-tRNA synthetase class 2
MPSMVIRTWTYDPDGRRLDVTFVSGRRYAYHEVPPDLADEMKLAFAKGEFFNKRVKDRFPFTREA